VLDFSSILKDDHFYVLDDHLNRIGHEVIADVLLEKHQDAVNEKVENEEYDMEIIRDLWGFLKERKKWWAVADDRHAAFGSGVLIFSSGSAVAPFILYPVLGHPHE